MLIFVYILGLVFETICSDESYYPTKCETCAIVVNEWIMATQRNIKRTESEFEDVAENICERLSEYKVHKEKVGLERFSKDESKTLKSLKDLHDKGVQVELGIPYEMWDKPSEEIVMLKMECEKLMEEFEEVVENWFLKNLSNKQLMDQLCLQNALIGSDVNCIKTSRMEL